MKLKVHHSYPATDSSPPPPAAAAASSSRSAATTTTMKKEIENQLQFCSHSYFDL
ncbi:MAG: hypothetical protein MHMPM18_001453 [Marteilia pararefringens]